jgi:S-DNA-T family DNA segregation ATPase FtsK/SpoIIIE
MIFCAIWMVRSGRLPEEAWREIKALWRKIHNQFTERDQPQLRPWPRHEQPIPPMAQPTRRPPLNQTSATTPAAPTPTAELPPLDIDYERLKRQFQTGQAQRPPEQELPVLELSDLQQNLHSSFRPRRERRPSGPPTPAPSPTLPLIDPNEVKANLRQIHGHRLHQASPNSSVFRVLATDHTPPKTHRRETTDHGLFSSSVRFSEKPRSAVERSSPSVAGWISPAPTKAPPASDAELKNPFITEPVTAPLAAPQPEIVHAEQPMPEPAPPAAPAQPIYMPQTPSEAPKAEPVTNAVWQAPHSPMSQPAIVAAATKPALPWDIIEAAPPTEASLVAAEHSSLVWLHIEERFPSASAPQPAFQPQPIEATPPIMASAPARVEPLPVVYGDVCLPPLDLLHPAEEAVQSQLSQDMLLDRGILIEEKLAEFKVKVSVVDAYAGPVITRYEVEPAVGVRGNQVVNLMKDLSRALGLASIRVVETIPGKTCMGLELPNPTRQMIRLSEILSAEVFQRSSSLLTMALGKDITGEPVVMDLAKAPHLLVAGTTGSGKSVGVNAMILSLLYKASPDQVRFIMIDPKMLELSVYNDIPHLLAPVVTDMKLAANALNWCVGEMDKRYRLMSALGVRNLAGYNEKILNAEQAGRKLTNPFSLTPEAPEPLAPLPFIVVVVDEFADLMMVAGKKIEELIARLAQKARAAGIHLILATQRPSVDVITGLIKANIPTRIAFQVSSKIDSRTILDQMGAESLLGQGDMLFLPPGTGYPQRVHGAFVTDSEVHQVVEHLKQFGEPDYVEGLLTGESEADEEAAAQVGKTTAETDPLYDEAVEIVLRTRKASISSVQRHLRIGYNRAARLIEEMESAGLVSAMENNGNRSVLVPERSY